VQIKKVVTFERVAGTQNSVYRVFISVVAIHAGVRTNGRLKVVRGHLFANQLSG
jgi:hypothetical protein